MALTPMRNNEPPQTVAAKVVPRARKDRPSDAPIASDGAREAQQTDADNCKSARRDPGNLRPPQQFGEIEQTEQRAADKHEAPRRTAACLRPSFLESIQRRYKGDQPERQIEIAAPVAFIGDQGRRAALEPARRAPARSASQWRG
jgi:hypothetical protein